MIGDTFGVIVRDKTSGHWWYALIGTKEQVDIAFDWCALNLGRQTEGWFSIYSHEQDAIFLDVHIFAEPVNQIFEREFAPAYLQLSPPPMSESERPLRLPSGKPGAEPDAPQSAHFT